MNLDNFLATQYLELEEADWREYGNANSGKGYDDAFNPNAGSKPQMASTGIALDRDRTSTQLPTTSSSQITSPTSTQIPTLHNPQSTQITAHAPLQIPTPHNQQKNQIDSPIFEMGPSNKLTLKKSTQIAQKLGQDVRQELFGKLPHVLDRPASKEDVSLYANYIVKVLEHPGLDQKDLGLIHEICPTLFEVYNEFERVKSIDASTKDFVSAALEILVYAQVA